MLALLSRHATNLMAAVVALADPAREPAPAGALLLVALSAWALYRLISRSLRARHTVVDCAFVLAVCLASPLFTADPGGTSPANLQTAVLSVTLIGIAVALPVAASIPLAVLLLGGYFVGSAAVIGWHEVAVSVELRYLSAAAVMSVLLRLSLLRVEAATRRAHEDLVSAGNYGDRVAAATRDREVEQFALLHDTAASTLLLVAEGTPVPRGKLAAQARQALAVLEGRRSAPPPSMDLVGAVREVAETTVTPVRFAGSAELWLDGEVGVAVESAAREVLNNVDRHAGAAQVTIDIAEHRLTIADDGCGFDRDRAVGAGIRDSIVGRMRRAGGDATIDSRPGQGSKVTLSWPESVPSAASPTSAARADRLVVRVRRRYGLALVGWSLLVTAMSVGFSLRVADPFVSEVALALVTVAACVTAVPILYGRAVAYRWPAVGALIGVAVLQPVLLPTDAVCTTAHWSLRAASWSLSGLVLGLRLSVAFCVLAGYWVAVCASALIRDPAAGTAVALGYLLASLGALLVAAQFADRIFADAAADTQERTQAQMNLLARQQAAVAAHDDFQRRVTEVRQRIEPLLVRLSRDEPVDQALRRSARIESQRLRTFLDLHSPREHTLVRSLRPALDAAVHRNVEVTVHADPNLPVLSTAASERIVERLARIIEECTSTARIVLTSTSEHVAVSVVCRGDITAYDDGESMTSDRMEVVRRDDTTWITFYHDPPPRTHSDNREDQCDAAGFSSAHR